MEPKRKDFSIVFKKLEETLIESGRTSDTRGPDMSREEFNEIDELRRLSLEVEDPEPESHTTT